MYARVSLILALSGLVGCAAEARQHDGSDDTEPAMTASGEWQVLFDGSSTDAWRGYRMDTLPDGWQIVDNTLARVAQAGDIVTRDAYRNFELELEWRIEAGGNSGIMFRVTEDLTYPWESGPEMQILDDEAHADGLSPETSAGSNYALHPPEPRTVRPVGEWNRVRLVVNANHVEHWLNGVKVVEYELGSADWEARVAASKFATMPRYGREPTGHIALQDHGDPVAFRDIRIRVLPD